MILAQKFSLSIRPGHSWSNRQHHWASGRSHHVGARHHLHVPTHRWPHTWSCREDSFWSLFTQTFWHKLSKTKDTISLPGPPGIMPCGGGPIMGIIGGPPIGGAGSMPGRGGPPLRESSMSVDEQDCCTFLQNVISLQIITSVNTSLCFGRNQSCII